MPHQMSHLAWLRESHEVTTWVWAIWDSMIFNCDGMRSGEQ